MLPVLLGAVIYAFVDHRIGIQANFGADGVGTWIAWAYSVPAVIVYAIPAVGVAAELMPVTFKHRQPMRGQIFAVGGQRQLFFTVILAPIGGSVSRLRRQGRFWRVCALRQRRPRAGGIGDRR